MTGIVLRPAVPGDAEFLISVARRLGEVPIPSWRTPHEVAVADLDQMLAAVGRGDDDSLVLLAESNIGNPLGCLFVSPETDFFTGAPGGHVEVVAVAAEAEGRGVARRLMEAGEAWARERGYHFLTLNVFVANERARSVYEALGYSPETVRYRKSL